MTRDSFNIGSPNIPSNINSVDAWGLKVIHHNMLNPERRARTNQIPFRDGSYDYGDEYYNDRPLEVYCHLTRYMTENELDEVRYQLNRRINIYFWDREDKYYSVKLYSLVPIINAQQHIMREFTLTFMCVPPFAIGKRVVTPLSLGHNEIDYKGTARTPTLIIIQNTGTQTIRGLTLTAARRIS